MATITLKNVPKELHAALKRRAKLHKRSLNQEAIHCIDLALERNNKDAGQILAELRKLRSEIPLKQVDLNWISKARHQGRP